MGRKLKAALVGIIVAVVKVFAEKVLDVKLPDELLLAIEGLLATYILGTAIEDHGVKSNPENPAPRDGEGFLRFKE